jgi:hypothetical protein
VAMWRVLGEFKVVFFSAIIIIFVAFWWFLTRYGVDCTKFGALTLWN